VEKKVDTLADQIEELYKRKIIETFTYKNWDRVHRVGTSKDGSPLLEVQLEQPPIPGIVEVFEGPLLCPSRTIRFPATPCAFQPTSKSRVVPTKTSL
jgi:hypothetical protein